jgi:predicted dehydrogenase
VKVLICGLGSIGQRHARNLRTLLGDELELLAYRVRGEEIDEDLGLRTFTDPGRALFEEEPDVVFVTNPASEHVRIARAAAYAGCHLFIEKPLSDRLNCLDELIEVVDRGRLVAMVGYQLRFHPSFARFQDFLMAQRVENAYFEIGEYLPDMHPWEDYRRLNYSRREQGGGVLLQFSHEFDLAYGLFGMPHLVTSVGGKLSDLEIDVEDTADTVLDYGDLAVDVHQDFVQRPPVRRYELASETQTVEWDNSVDRNEVFLAELRHFLACVRGDETPVVDLRAGRDVLRIALAARRSMETGEAVEP